jgi:hypothetical protein
MTIVITAFERSPDGGKGLARDTRVRWALEEVGQSYEVRLVSRAFSTSSRNLLSMLPGVRHGPHTNGPSQPNWRSTPLIRKPADEILSRVAVVPALRW